MKGNVYVICEGGMHTLAYLASLGLAPTKVFFGVLEIKKQLPYMQEQDKVIVVLEGFTEYSIKQFLELEKALYGVFPPNCRNVLIFTPFKIPRVGTPYFIYDRDLLYGEITAVIEGKVTSLKTYVESEIFKGNVKKETGGVKNIVLSPYIEYDSVNVELSTLIVEEAKEESLQDEQPDIYTDLIVEVNMYTET